MVPFPQKYNTTLRYAETISLSTGAAGIVGTQQLFSINSLYDPNYSGTGHQPYGFDQLSPLYSIYIVKRVHITLIWTTIGNTADVCGVAYVANPNGYAQITGITVDAATERPGVSTVVVSSSGNTRTVRQTIEVDLPRLIGLSAPQYLAQLSVYGAAVTASPSLGISFALGVGSYSGVGSEAVTVQAVMSFDSEFSSRKTLGQS